MKRRLACAGLLTAMASTTGSARAQQWDLSSIFQSWGQSQEEGQSREQSRGFEPGALEGMPRPASPLGSPTSTSPTTASFDSAHVFVQRFGSKELTFVVDEALAHNGGLRAAFQRIVQADAAARVASAPLFPSLSLGGDSLRKQVPGTVSSAVPEHNPMADFFNAAGQKGAANLVQNQSTFNATRSNFFSLGLNASYMLDIWGVNADASMAARLQADASRFDRDAVEIATVVSVLNTYFTVLNAHDQLRIARKNVEIAKEVYRAIKARFDVGMVDALGLRQQETILNTQRASIPPLEQTAAQQRNVLAVLLGRTPQALKIAGKTLGNLKFPKLEPQLPGEVLLRRPDVAEAEAKLASQEFSVLQARALFLPQFTISGQYGIQSIVLKNLGRPEAIAWQVAAQIIQPIFDGWNLQGNLELQQGKYGELAALYRRQILAAIADAMNAVIAVEQSKRELDLLGAAVASAKGGLEAAQARLREGTIDVVTLAVTETQYFQAQLALEQARLLYFQSASTFYQALGGGWSPTTRAREIARANEAYEAGRGPWP